jgi:pyruvate formate lyase activating enzyme
MAASGMVFDIRKYSVHDGPGIRTTVFLKGCPLHCWWCHNPESQSPRPEPFLHLNRCIHCGICVETCPQGAISQPDGFQVVTDLTRCTVCGECIDACVAGAREIAGRSMTAGEVLAEVESDIPFFDESGGGVTFSGGEPMMQPDFLLELLQGCKQRELRTALDTSGFTPWEKLQAVAPFVDLFLYDIKLIDAEKHRRYMGVSNQIILENLHRLAALGKTIFIRVPLIPGINDDAENLEQLAQLAVSLPAVKRVDLLPYHHAAMGKYDTLEKNYALRDLQPHPYEAVARIADALQARGLNVRIGG